MKKKTKIGIGIGIGIVVLLCMFWIGFKSFLIHYGEIGDKEYKSMFAKVTDLPITQNTENQNDKVGKMHYFIPEKFQLKKETEEQKE